MTDQKCIIIGASHAASQAAAALRQQGWQGSITIIGDEPYLPYHRPPLSKDYLSGAKTLEEIFIRQQAFYEKADVDFILGVKVTSINRVDKKIVVDGGESLDYDKLLITTGAKVRELTVPGSDLGGVCYLRDLNDVHRVREYAGEGKNAVIIGGGYIGLETAASLRKLGMNVTVLEFMPRVLQRVTAPEISAFYTRVHTEEGVRIITEVQVEALEGTDDVEAVLCSNGERIPASLVVVGIGVLPNVELAEEAGLKVDNGIVVDEFCRTSDPDILAAGDCASHHNLLYDRHLRLESVQNANDQATVAAHTICGKEKIYDSLPWFWSDQFDLKLQICGLSLGYTDVVIRGDIESGRSFAAFYLDNDRLLAVDAVNRPQDFMIGKRLITEKRSIDKAKLADASIPLKDFLA